MSNQYPEAKYLDDRRRGSSVRDLPSIPVIHRLALIKRPLIGVEIPSLIDYQGEESVVLGLRRT